MQRHRSITQFFLAISALLIAVSLTAFAFAQAKAPAKPAAQAPAAGQLYSVTILKLKPGMAPEWQEFRKNETIPALLKAGTKQQGVWRTAIFGEGEWIIVTPIESLAQYDNPAGPIVRALGQEGARAYNQKAARFVESSRTFAIQIRPDLSIAPKPDEPFKVGMLSTATVAPGRTEEYENFIKTAVLPLMKKTGVRGNLRSKVALGGNPDEYGSMLLFDSFAELEKWREAFAKESAAAKLAGKSAGIVTHRQNAVYRFVPELSIVPAPQKAENR